jgi:cytochrome c-type biogenesis protein CcmH
LHRAFLAAACAVAFQLVLPAAGAAETAGWAYSLAGELLSPYCPGRTLADCPSQDAQTLRIWLISQEAAGRSQADVEAELVERFGEEILGAPPPRGFGLVAYVVPFAAFVLGGLVVAVFLRRHMAPVPEAGTDLESGTDLERPLDPELERIVEEELSR